ncbi:MAG: stage IV sporulation protein A [Eubacteriales bacterium]|nr:stage IV sporulation protein A [Eubacteriales bacterium]
MGAEKEISNPGFDIYSDIRKRTNGEIYLGVVGPVRTGKSTFIKRFMELAVLGNMRDEHERKRATDELPQSAAGTTVMTIEPKFIPSEAALIYPYEGVSMKVRLIDCVGYMVDGANGHMENGKERMVKTPWSESEMPFSKASTIGTKKVIEEHSTIGIVVTTDGSFTEIDRSSYVDAEKKTISELKALSKPFVVILNCIKPYSKETLELSKKMSEEYGINVIPVNCDQLKNEDINKIFASVLKEFPVTEIDFFAPSWMDVLPDDHWLKKELLEEAMSVLEEINSIGDAEKYKFDNDNEYIDNLKFSSIRMSDGVVDAGFSIATGIYYDILSELTGTRILNEYELISTIRDLAVNKKEYENVSGAISEVNLSGYGIVTPVRDEIILDEPVVIKNGNKYGVKIKAQVPSINLLKTQINVEIAPIVGTKNQAEDLINYIKDNTKDNPEGIWETNIFGKTIEQIVEDGIYEKTHNITKENMNKISETLEKVMNENSGLVCLIV